MAGNPAHRSRFLVLAQQRAKRLLKDPEALTRLARRAEDKEIEEFLEGERAGGRAPGQPEPPAVPPSGQAKPRWWE
jgi:hypothetical protein